MIFYISLLQVFDRSTHKIHYFGSDAPNPKITFGASETKIVDNARAHKKVKTIFKQVWLLLHRQKCATYNIKISINHFVIVESLNLFSKFQCFKVIRLNLLKQRALNQFKLSHKTVIGWRINLFGKRFGNTIEVVGMKF